MALITSVCVPFRFKEAVSSDRMKSVIQIAKEGDIMHGITAANSMTELEMRALQKAFVKKQRPEHDPIDDLATQVGSRD